MINLKAKRILIRLKLHGPILILLAVAVSAATETGHLMMGSVFALFFFVYAVTMRINPLARIWERRTIQHTACPACGQEIDLVDIWSCGCGYVTWEPRHAFSPCPRCGKGFAWLVCSRCEASIPF